MLNSLYSDTTSSFFLLIGQVFSILFHSFYFILFHLFSSFLSPTCYFDAIVTPLLAQSRETFSLFSLVISRQTKKNITVKEIQSPHLHIEDVGVIVTFMLVSDRCNN